MADNLLQRLKELERNVYCGQIKYMPDLLNLIREVIDHIEDSKNETPFHTIVPADPADLD